MTWDWKYAIWMPRYIDDFGSRTKCVTRTPSLPVCDGGKPKIFHFILTLFQRKWPRSSTQSRKLWCWSTSRYGRNLADFRSMDLKPNVLCSTWGKQNEIYSQTLAGWIARSVALINNGNRWTSDGSPVKFGCSEWNYFYPMGQNILQFKLYHP